MALGFIQIVMGFWNARLLVQSVFDANCIWWQISRIKE